MEKMSSCNLSIPVEKVAVLPQEVEVKVVVAVVVSAPTLGRCAAVDPRLPPEPNKICHEITFQGCIFCTGFIFFPQLQNISL